jgi:hypothetical protein
MRQDEPRASQNIDALAGMKTIDPVLAIHSCRQRENDGFGFKYVIFKFSPLSTMAIEAHGICNSSVV